MRSFVTVGFVALLALSSCGDDASDDDAAVESSTSDATTTSAPLPAEPLPTEATSPATPDGTDASTAATSEPGVRPEGFGTMAARSTAADGTVCELCLWIADDEEQRPRGLMGVTDLAGRDGMAFVYTEPHTTAFTMRNTIMPLSIAFFGPDGSQLGNFDMEPCTAEPCPLYPTPDGFTVAVEVPQGAIDELAMGPGSRLDLLGTDCPLQD
ncbi:MAG TPA: DUF192 domain-containing protein [Ilumatobacteraceae bacterium]